MMIHESLIKFFFMNRDIMLLRRILINIDYREKNIYNRDLEIMTDHHKSYMISVNTIFSRSFFSGIII